MSGSSGERGKNPEKRERESGTGGWFELKHAVLASDSEQCANIFTVQGILFLFQQHVFINVHGWCTLGVCVCVCGFSSECTCTLSFQRCALGLYRCLHECCLCVCLWSARDGPVMDPSPMSTTETKSVPSASVHVTSAQMNKLRFIQLIFSDASHPTDPYLGDQNVSGKCLKVPLGWCSLWESERLDSILGDCDLSISRSFIMFYTSAVCPQRSGPATGCRCFPQHPSLPNQVKYCPAASHKSIFASDTVTLCDLTLSRCSFFPLELISSLSFSGPSVMFTS